MFQLSEEETLMYSSDNSVKLTTHRIIFDSEKGRKQIMLEDIETYKLKGTSIGAYGILLLIFVIFTAWVSYEKISNYIDSRRLFSAFNISFFEHFVNDPGYFVLCGILIIFYHFYRISRRNYIQVIGKYNTFQFRVKSFKNKSIVKMLEKMTEQSAKIRANGSE
jgi:hypothetical protein